MAKNRNKKKAVNRFPTYDDDRAKIVEDVEKDRIPAILISVAETVGLTQEEILSYNDKEGLVSAIEKVDLYNRCRQEIGLTDVQIAVHPDAESLLQYANGIHPGSNVDARVKEGVRPEPMKFEDNMPDSFTLESILEAKSFSTNRDHFDRGNLQAFLRRINRRYGPFEPVRIVKDTSFKVVKRELVTKFTIYYK